MKSKKQNNTLYSSSIILLKLILFPVMIVIIALIILSYYSYAINKEQIQASLTSTLNQYSSQSESQIQNIINLASVLQNDPDFIAALSADSRETVIDYSSVSDTMKSYINSYENIDNIFIYDKTIGRIIDASGTHNYKDYLTVAYAYESYSPIYWNSLLFFEQTPYRILSPTVVNADSQRKHIIPVVFRWFGKQRLSNTLVINISLDSLMRSNDSYKYTPNTHIYILNKFNGQLFGTEPGFVSKKILDTELYKSLVSEQRLFESYVNGKKCQIIAISATDTLVGYTYFAAVPFSDMYRMQSSLIWVTVITAILFIALAILISMHNSIRLAKPLHTLADILNVNLDDRSAISSRSFLDSMRKRASDLSQQNSRLAATLPFAQENYLIKFLNSTDYTIDRNALEIIRNSLPFKYDLFAAVVVQLYPTDAFHKAYNSSEYFRIQSGFHDIVKDLFSTHFDTFCLPSAKESLYIILNVPDVSAMSTIDNIIETIFDCMKYDADFVNIYIGKGGIYKNLEGLKHSHDDAIKNLKVMPTPVSQIEFAQTKQPMSTLGKNTEDKIFNHLIMLDTEHARELIVNTVYDSNITDERQRKQLLSQILILLFRVMKIKNIEIDNEKMDFELFLEILENSADKIYRTILLYLDKIDSYARYSAERFSGNSIIEYIDDNYLDPNISLDAIASHFHTTTSYVSLMVKNKLGIGFYKYISGRRIEQAKLLLDTTDKNIQQICTETGFNSKQTFFRTFKQNTGITPSEYRKRKS